MGVQSADEDYKRQQLLRMERGAHLTEALRALGAAGVGIHLDHMLGLPGEPRAAQEKARALYAELTPRRVTTYWLTHLPGVQLTREAVKSGHLSEDDYARVNRGETRLFHSRAAGLDAEAEAFYQRYELLFRVLPLL